MNSLPLLITYYNNVPPNATNYFTISSGKLIISSNDMMGTGCSLFLTNANNNLVYILNGANMGAFIINSLVSSNEKSITYSINLTSIPLNLTDNVLCVLSTTIPTYNLTRNYLSNMNSDVGNFNSPDNKKFIINTKSLIDDKTKDDTLFLYIIITNKSFNIILNETTINTISNITLLPESNKTSIVLSGTAPPLKFSDNTNYVIYISTDKSSTVSNITFNNTVIKPLNFSGIDLTSLSPTSLNGKVADMSRAPSNSIKVIPVLMNQTLKANKKSLNTSVNNQTLLNQCVILNIQNPKVHNLSGYFSFELINLPENRLIPGLNVNVKENFTNDLSPSSSSTPSTNIIMKQIQSKPSNNSLFSSLTNIGSTISDTASSLSKNTYDTVITTTGIPHDSVMTVTSGLTTAATVSYDSISYAAKVVNVNVQKKTKPDNINNVPLLVGLPSSLNVSYYDLNNHQINFIAPNIIIYLTSGLRTIIYSVSNSKNSIDKPNENSILSFNGEINANGLPDYSKNTPYVLSTGPITPYVTYSFNNLVEYNTPIKNGAFSVMSRDSKLIFSNSDATGMNAVPFISLLYTIIKSHLTLNILNLDYSISCSLIITGVALSQTQSTVSYSIKSGSIPKTNSNYIFTLLESSDIILSVNNSKLYNEILTKNNNLILGIQNSIYNSYINYPEDPNIQQAQIIISNAASQATILLTTPFINNDSTTLQIANATITMAFNAINYALLGDPDSAELDYFYNILTQLSNPIIVTTLLNNTLNHITTLINENQASDNLPLFKKAENAINNALSQITVPSALDSPALNTPSSVYIPLIQNAIEAVNEALVILPDNSKLLKAQSTLLAVEPIASGVYKIEKMESRVQADESSTPSTIGIICGLLCCLVFIGAIAYLINSYLSKGDKELFSTESSSSDSSSSGITDSSD